MRGLREGRQQGETISVAGVLRSGNHRAGRRGEAREEIASKGREDGKGGRTAPASRGCAETLVLLAKSEGGAGSLCPPPPAGAHCVRGTVSAPGT